MSPATIIDLDNVENYSISIVTKKELSTFDKLIQTSWQEKMDAGYFRYPFSHPECKKLPGRLGYLAQFNSFRVSARRTPQAMMSVTQPFDPEKFNFNRVDLDKGM